MSRDWTPVRDGEFYCSPACGGKKSGICTYAAYEAAEREATACLALIGGWPFQKRVTENLGWHWALVLPLAKEVGHLVEPQVTVSPDGSRFHAWLNTDVNGPTAIGHTPGEALRGLLARQNYLKYQATTIVNIIEGATTK